MCAELKILFFDKRVRSFMSRTAVSLKFKMRWFTVDDASYRAENVVNIYKFENNVKRAWNLEKNLNPKLVLDYVHIYINELQIHHLSFITIYKFTPSYLCLMMIDGRHHV